MLATLVIGLREGLEAALIVGIIAAFLKQTNRADALRQVWIGVGIAVGICLGVGIALQVLRSELPQRQQEMLEAVPIRADVTDRASLAAAARQVQDELGGANVLVNNAGVMLLGPFSAEQRADYRPWLKPT